MKSKHLLLFLFLFVLLLFSCSTSKKLNKIRLEKGNDNSFVYLKRASDLHYYYSKREVERHLGFKIDSFTVTFWGSQTEISNKSYWTFLNSLKDSDSISKFQKHKPKTSNWKNFSDNFYFADSLSLYYDSLELFGNYPVVNITPEDALAYIDWLNEIEPDSLVFYKLFSPDEFIYFFNDLDETDSTFSWGTNYWKNNNNYDLGNFAEFDQNQIRYSQNSDEISFYNKDSIGYLFHVNGPREVYDYNPNRWGAYNLSGNVAEINTLYIKIKDDWHCTTIGGSWSSPVYYLRKNTTETYKLPSPFVGFRVMKLQLIIE
jgi:formylglycine-generating enzyme required for sulfatase activity